jgi:homoserine kinase type II
MAVFTDVSTEQAQALLDTLSLGELQSLKGITAGIENTNYFVTTTRDGEQHDYVLTIFERLSFEQLPFYLELMRHLARKGVPVPAPQPDASDRILHTVAGKPAAVVDKLRGGHQLAPDQFHCEQVGAGLARMHLAGQDFPLHQDNLRSLPGGAKRCPSCCRT